MREVFEYTQFWAIGSGHEFSLGAMHHAYSLYESAEGNCKGQGSLRVLLTTRTVLLPITFYSMAINRS
jgi:ATP-dependent HslUV protease subunit HslV